ncbi:MAG: amino acid adenylation domain-containing protein [Chloroflexota bacterium]
MAVHNRTERERERESLSDAKKALLKKRLQAKRNKATTTTGIPRQTDEGPSPLSFSQERLWFLEYFQPDTAAFNLPHAIRMKGYLEFNLFQTALNMVVARHESLRTYFIKTDAGAQQVILPKLNIAISVIDLQEYAAEEQIVKADAYIERDADQPHDITQAPLFRMALIQLAADDQILIVNMHHIISDGWSMTIFTQELFQAYTALVSGEEPSFPELPIQYRDYAVWQRTWLHDNVFEQQLTYWRRQLAQAPAIQTLPSDKPRPEVQTFNTAKHPLHLSAGVTLALKAISQEAGATLYMTLLAGFKLVLSRYLGQTDIVVGTPMANRNRTEVENMIGFMLNTLILRTDLSGNPTFVELLRRIKDVAIGAYANQDIPFEKLVEDLGPERHLNYTPLFQNMFNFHNNPTPDYTLPGLVLTPYGDRGEVEKFDLTFSLYEQNDQVKGHISYNTDLFEDDAMARLANHYQTMLAQIAQTPYQPIAQFSLLNPTEKQQILIDWNDTQAPYPQQSIPDLFEAQVEETPQATALLFGEQTMTFAELNQQANQLAHYLLAHNIGKGDFVAVSLERSPHMIVALFAILKTGAAYLPLDPAYPQERLTFMLADTEPKLLITETTLAAQFVGHTEKIVCLDTATTDLKQFSDQNPSLSSPLALDDVAYVIYTSGSTGRPKGVLGLHRGAINRFHWMWQTYPFAEQEVGCQKTALSFVDSVWEIFGTLLAGIPLVIIPDDIVKDTKQFIATLKAHQVSRIVLVPSLLRVMLDIFPDLQQQVPALQFWVTSGEVIPIALARQFSHQMPGRTLINLYGSSEVSADVTYFDVSHDKISDTVPIGYPIANTAIYLLDQDLNPVPVGVPGHLYVSGAGLAQGYLKRPDMTTERFIDNPFKTVGYEKLYQTGDLAKYRVDGAIEFLGRSDHQVKIRGYRIELGEVEEALAQHEAVTQAIVMVIEHQPDNTQLIAYITSNAAKSLVIDDLRQSLKQKLPAYMIPAVFIELDAFPLTPNGKIDRQALQKIKPATQIGQAAIVPPRNQTEETLLGIWCAILKLDNMSIHDDFFDIGGHSLLAVQLFDQIEKKLQQTLPLVTLIQAPTIAELAKILIGDEPVTPPPILTPIQEEGTEPPFFGVHGGNGEVLFYRQLAKELGPNQPLYAFRRQDLVGEENIAYASIEDAAAQYIVAMKTIQPQGPYHIGGYCIGGIIAFEMAQQLSEAGDEVALVALIGTGFPPQTSRPKGHYFKRVTHHWKQGRLLDQVTQFSKRWVSKKARRFTENLMPSPDTVDSVNLKRNKLVSTTLNTRVRQKYQPKTYHGQITLIETSQITLPYWVKLSAQPVNCHIVPGRHSTMFQDPYVQTLAQNLQRYLKS